MNFKFKVTAFGRENVCREPLGGFLQLRRHIIQHDYQLLKQVFERELFKACNTEQFRTLTGREVEILQLLAAGLNNPEIAERLLISRNTVETHRKHLNRKLNIKSYNKLIKFALAFDLVKF